MDVHREFQQSPGEPECNLPCTVVALMLWSDTTHLTTFGNTKLWPVYMYFGKARNTVSRYLNWEAEAFTLPWIGLCSGLSVSLPLSQNLRYHIGVVAMKQLYMVTPVGPWMKGRIVNTYRYSWWKGSFADIPDEDLLGSYLNCIELKAMIAEHYEQLPEGTGLVTPATLIIPKSTPVAQQLSNIASEVEHEGRQIVKMLEDKVIEAQIVAASLLQMESALGEDIMTAIAATEKLVKFLKRETSP
ncbi:hypothetical protein DFJ58DRAFT_725694 [Suillus subalutaceus]|uniref:uncharacterized protein n=1 Tax=Suillus subalutaceus TaxID=48586 RepID=UPI001B86588A|nr:uncharacterized protein DFJ58DRAFT_725694 [Suillus subalutaceus]KAG1861513.1 hypothetical protein DFJ58DRAFT_725694 [Suillus subalutaceus]